LENNAAGMPEAASRPLQAEASSGGVRVRGNLRRLRPRPSQSGHCFGADVPRNAVCQEKPGGAAPQAGSK